MASNQTLTNCYLYPEQSQGYISNGCTQQHIYDTKQSECYTFEQHSMYQHLTSLELNSIRRHQPQHVSSLNKQNLSNNVNVVISSRNNVLLDKYVTLERIGNGTFGDIWSAMSKYDVNRRYAIKFLKYKQEWNERQRERHELMFVSEGNKLRYLNGLKTSEIGKEFIIKCMELHKTSAIGPCIVMELCGYSLLSYMKLHESTQLSLSLQSMRYIALQLLSAMSFMHGVGGMIHADLKPENVLLHCGDCGGDALNTMPRIKIVDFGNAISFDKTLKSFNVQTLWYRAPEVLFGNKNEMSSLADLWSVGCILYELLSVNMFNTKHQRLFRCSVLRKAHIIHKISQEVSKFPVYVYNKYKCYYFDGILEDLSSNCENECNVDWWMHNSASYMDLKRDRMSKLMEKLGALNSVFLQNESEYEYISLIDLISCLLDLNPLTRYTSEDAIRHRFIINKYAAKESNDLQNVHPIIKASSDEERQNRINQLTKEHKVLCCTQCECDVDIDGLDPANVETIVHRHLY